MTPCQLIKIRAESERAAKVMTMEEVVRVPYGLTPYQFAEAVILWKSLNKASKDGYSAALSSSGSESGLIKTHSCIHVTQNGKTCARCGEEL